MKKLAVLLLLIAMLAVPAAVTLAAPAPPLRHYGGHWHGYPGPYCGDPGNWRPPVSYLQDDARNILRRTAQVLWEAQVVAKRQYYRFGLGLAMAHQQKARELYWQGFYRDAIFHSIRARNMALQIINRDRWNWSYSWEPREDNYRRQSPCDADLDNRLNRILIHSDDDAVYFHFDLDLNF